MKPQSRLERQSAIARSGARRLRPAASNDESRAIPLHRTRGILASELRHLKDALNSITQGLVVFDANEMMVVCNDRYFEMYGLSKETTEPGCSLETLLENRKQAGFLTGDVDDYHSEIITRIRRGKTTSQYNSTPDGRIIHVVNSPLANGGWVATHEDVTELKQSEAQIAHMAHHDALTGLPNREMFKVRLDHALRWNDHDKHLAVLFIDLDNFKNINDTLGHQIGDDLLQVVATRLRQCVRETDAVARLGGDEFAVIQSDVEDPAAVAHLADEIRDAITAPCRIMSHDIIVDTSIGIALAPTDGETPEQLIKSADLALYGAKGDGRGTYRFFEQEMDARMAARHALELDLRSALANGEFEIHYQPLVNLERGEISCCEALLRWDHPERGPTKPEEFIPVAEETGLITRIGEWVIRTACMEAVGWPKDVMLAVNVSPVQFRSDNIVQVITHALAASGLPANRLEIEITEAVLLDQTEMTLEKLGQLHTLGVSIAMDDFGTGYSSLGYLQKFPFDKIKIDGSFIRDLSERSESTAIVRAVTGLASSFRMVTTAEGVETEEQLRIVRELGCTEMQGYLFSKACHPDKLAQLLKSRPNFPNE